MHESLLLQHSELFCNEIVDEPFIFKEADDLTMQTFLHWLYFQKSNNDQLKSLTTSELLRVWVFADKSGIELLKRDAMKQLRPRASPFHVICLNKTSAPEEVRTAFSFSDIAYVFVNTSNGAEVRALLLSWFIANCDSMELNVKDVEVPDVPHHFLWEALKGVAKRCKTLEDNKKHWTSVGEKAQSFGNFGMPSAETAPATRSSSRAGSVTSHAALTPAPTGTSLFSSFGSAAPATPAVSKASAGQTSTSSVFGGFGTAPGPSAPTTSIFGQLFPPSAATPSLFGRAPEPRTSGFSFPKAPESKASTPKTSMFPETILKHGSETDSWPSLSEIQEYRFLSTGMIRLREEMNGPTFDVTREKVSGTHNTYQSLSAMPQYQSLSYEELRLKARLTRLTRLTR